MPSRPPKALSSRAPPSHALALLLLAGCATVRPSPPLSSLDARYRLQRRMSPASGAVGGGPSNPSVSFYQQVLRRTLGSHCSLLPHDSALAQWRLQRCGTVPAVVQSMARFYLETDAPQLALPVTVLDGRLKYLDLPEGCGSSPD